MNLTQKQENFTLNLFKGMSQREAYIKAGYSTNYAVTVIDSNACRMAANSKVLARWNELKREAEDKAIMDKKEILKTLSVIGRAKLTDFMTAGADGSWVDIGPENEHAGALQEITSRTEYDKDGSSPAVITKIKLLSPIQAMQEIAKLQGDYAPEKHVNVNLEASLTDEELTNIITGRSSKRITQETEST